MWDYICTIIELQEDHKLCLFGNFRISNPASAITLDWLTARANAYPNVAWKLQMSKLYCGIVVWRDGRAAEGGGLLNRYRAKHPIEGSNPSSSVENPKEKGAKE